MDNFMIFTSTGLRLDVNRSDKGVSIIGDDKTGNKTYSWLADDIFFEIDCHPLLLIKGELIELENAKLIGTVTCVLKIVK